MSGNKLVDMKNYGWHVIFQIFTTKKKAEALGKMKKKKLIVWPEIWVHL